MSVISFYTSESATKAASIPGVHSILQNTRYCTGTYMFNCVYLLVCNEDTVGVFMLTSNLIVGKHVSKLLYKVQYLHTVCEVKTSQHVPLHIHYAKNSTISYVHVHCTYLFVPGNIGHCEIGCL